MPPQNTLLGLLGNAMGFNVQKNMTSDDLPTLKSGIHGFLDASIEAGERQQVELSKPIRPGSSLTEGDLFNLAMGMAGGGPKKPTLPPMNRDRIVDYLKKVFRHGYKMEPSPRQGSFESVFPTTKKEFIIPYGATSRGTKSQPLSAKVESYLANRDLRKPVVDASINYEAIQQGMNLGKNPSSGLGFLIRYVPEESGGGLPSRYITDISFQSPQLELARGFRHMGGLSTDMAAIVRKNLSKYPANPKWFKAAQLSGGLFRDFLKAVPRGSVIDPHPMNINSLTLALREISRRKSSSTGSKLGEFRLVNNIPMRDATWLRTLEDVFVSEKGLKSLKRLFKKADIDFNFSEAGKTITGETSYRVSYPSVLFKKE